jgi:hypothetical protein
MTGVRLSLEVRKMLTWLTTKLDLNQRQAISRAVRELYDSVKKTG